MTQEVSTSLSTCPKHLVTVSLTLEGELNDLLEDKHALDTNIMDIREFYNTNSCEYESGKALPIVKGRLLSLKALKSSYCKKGFKESIIILSLIPFR